MVVVYKILYLIKFLYVAFLLFFGFAFTWNLVVYLIRFKDSIPDKVRIEYTEDRISAGGSTYFRFGYLHGKTIYLDNDEIQNDTTIDVWRTTEGNKLHAYDRKIAETRVAFKYRLVSRYFFSLLIWLGIFFVLHITTVIIRKYVYIEEIKPSPPKDIFEY